MNLKFLSSHACSSDFVLKTGCSNNLFSIGKNDVKNILATKDGKIEFIFFEDHILAFVKSAMGHDAYYHLKPISLKKPIKAILMDLDGTSVRSEDFWIWIIQLTVVSLLGNPGFELDQTDIPFVSGHSVSEHLEYCIQKYCPNKTVEEARNYYFKHTSLEMNKIMEGKGRVDAFKPAPGLKDFLLELKTHNIKIGLVTSGLYEKAWPEILSAFRSMKLGNPEDFYDAIITAGFPLRKGVPGTLGELSPKPHPWLYAEAVRVGLGIEPADYNSVIGIEDSGAGICAVRLTGLIPVGVAGGNIIETGMKSLCEYYNQNLLETLNFII